MWSPVRLLTLSLPLLALSGCAGIVQSGQEPPTSAQAATLAEATEAQLISSPAPPTDMQLNPTITPAASTSLPCPVTIANGSTPPGENSSPGYHGNGTLWTALWPEGKVLIDRQQIRPDGSLGMKFPWWRGTGVVGELAITGRRLDATAPPLRAHIPEGYGNTGFQATGIIFPTKGCWQVTGRAGQAELTFVTLVVKVSR